MAQVAVISAVMGPDRAREDLLPYLLSKKSELDQVTLALAKSTEYFLPYIGGPEHAHTLIPLFEMLCCAEETVVRTAAAKSCSATISQLAKDVRLCSSCLLFISKRHFNLFSLTFSLCFFLPFFASYLAPKDQGLYRYAQ